MALIMPICCSAITIFLLRGWRAQGEGGGAEGAWVGGGGWGQQSRGGGGNHTPLAIAHAPEVVNDLEAAVRKVCGVHDARTDLQSVCACGWV